MARLNLITGIALNLKYDPQSTNSVAARKTEKSRCDSVSFEQKSLHVSSIQFFSSKIFLISKVKKIVFVFRGISQNLHWLRTTALGNQWGLLV